MQVGAFKTTWDELLVECDDSTPVDEVTDKHLGAYAGPDLTIMPTAANSEWRYDERPWLPGERDGDSRRRSSAFRRQSPSLIPGR